MCAEEAWCVASAGKQGAAGASAPEQPASAGDSDKALSKGIKKAPNALASAFSKAPKRTAKEACAKEDSKGSAAEPAPGKPTDAATRPGDAARQPDAANESSPPASKPRRMPTVRHCLHVLLCHDDDAVVSPRSYKRVPESLTRQGPRISL